MDDISLNTPEIFLHSFSIASCHISILYLQSPLHITCLCWVLVFVVSSARIDMIIRSWLILFRSNVLRGRGDSPGREENRAFMRHFNQTIIMIIFPVKAAGKTSLGTPHMIIGVFGSFYWFCPPKQNRSVCCMIFSPFSDCRAGEGRISQYSK